MTVQEMIDGLMMVSDKSLPCYVVDCRNGTSDEVATYGEVEVNDGEADGALLDEPVGMKYVAFYIG